VDTGIALLAYKEGIQDSKTLSSVVYSTIAGAGYAVFRVMLRKMLGAGEPAIGSIAFTFTVIGIINLLLLWPICLILYLTGVEIVPWITLLMITLLVGR
jgi:solute carrier family 35 protein F3/4